MHTKMSQYVFNFKVKFCAKIEVEGGGGVPKPPVIKNGT